MKSKEEIEQLAQEVHYESKNQGLNADGCFNQYQGFIKGYTQCQKDMADKRYTLDDMKKACACGIDIVCKEGPNDFQLFEDLINSLNKQD